MSWIKIWQAYWNTKIIVKRFRSVIFDSRTTLTGGGINTSINTITFLKEHSFVDGQEIVYDNQNSSSVSIASTTLFDGASYFASVLNNKTIRLYNTFEDQRTSTNPINIIDGGSGIQKFRSNDVDVELGMDHKEYSHTTKLSKENIASLSEDFS